MFHFNIPTPKDAQHAVRQANRYERAIAIIREGYTFSHDADLNVIYVCKPGRLSFDYIIYGDANNLTGKAGCDCPDMSKTDEPCKHYFSAKIDAERKAEDAADEAQAEAYDRLHAQNPLLPEGYAG